MNLSAEDAIIDEAAGLIMISFGYQNLPGAASTIITDTLEKTGVFEDIELVGEQNIYFNGHLFLRRIEGMDLQENIMQIVQTEGPLGGFCTAVWDGHYLSLPAVEVNEPGLLAHWRLDEIGGYTVYDEVGGNNALAIGGPVWHPNSGQAGGALEFDGKDDFVVSDCILNPADGPFSVFSWIKGGAPGQAIVSQQMGGNWLAIDNLQGSLMSEISSGNSDSTLNSDTVVTDGDWHHIGLTWDGSICVLHVDEVVVSYEMSAPEGSNGVLVIGCDTNMTTGSFFSGLIDDVRIYNQVATP
jgi:hypothetical protein